MTQGTLWTRPKLVFNLNKEIVLPKHKIASTFWFCSFEKLKPHFLVSWFQDIKSCPNYPIPFPSGHSILLAHSLYSGYQIWAVGTWHGFSGELPGVSVDQDGRGSQKDTWIGTIWSEVTAFTLSFARWLCDMWEVVLCPFLLEVSRDIGPHSLISPSVRETM